MGNLEKKKKFISFLYGTKEHIFSGDDVLCDVTKIKTKCTHIVSHKKNKKKKQLA